VTGPTGTLAWSETGEGPRALVLIHALGADSGMWERQVPELARLRRVITVELPGHGASPGPPGPYTVSWLGEEILQVVDSAGAQTFDVCGLSLGGIISLWMAADAPERVTALIASSTAARIGSEETWQARIEAVSEGGIEAIAEQALGRYFTTPFATAEPEIYQRTERTLLATDPDAYIACCAALRDADLRGLVGSIECPTLVIGGSEDVSTPPEQSQWLGEHIPGSRVAVISGAPHLANLERPGEWGDLVTGFLADLG
jgi:3-oxoadipate enol-lactonase